MVRYGWLGDVHQPGPGSEPPGPRERFSDDLAALVEEYGVADVFCTGDCAHPRDDDRGSVPHVTAADVDEFWRYVDASGYGERVRAIPGNHDVPLRTFLDSDDRALWRGRFTDDDVTVLVVTTAVPGAATGSPGRPDEQGGVGVNSGRVAYADLVWLERQLERAGDDAKVVLPHHPTYFVGDSALDAYSPDGSLRERNLYDVCRNYRTIHGVLSRFEKVLVPFSHLYQFASEGGSTVDGVTYAWKKHYYEFTADRLWTYAYIDVDADGARIVTVDRDGTARTVVERSWG